MSDNDIYFKNHATNTNRNGKYTEQISSKQLNAPAGAHALGKIKSDSPTLQTNLKSTSGGKSSNESNNKKKNTSTTKIAVTALICTFLIVITAVVVGAFSLAAYVLEDYSPYEFGDNEYVSESDLTYSDNVTNILLIGMDTLSSEDTTRSDTMMLVSLDKKNKTIKLSSFLRDTYAVIPGHGSAKLNAACTYGGAQLVCDSIEYNFGVRIDGYVMTGYDMFLEIIEAVDGITVPDIDETESKALAEAGCNIPAGENVYLTAKEALAYCRIRKGQSDFYRTTRQREVITLVIQKAMHTSPVKLIKAVHEICSKITCSLSKNDIFSVALDVLRCLGGEIQQFSVPADGTWYNDTINYQAVLVTDFEQNKEQLFEFIYN